MSGVEPVAPVAYTVPTAEPEADGTLAWDATTMVTARLRADGREGLGWTYAPAAAASVIAGVLYPAVAGHDAMDVAGMHEAMRRAARNALVPGLVTAAISAVDVAAWDLKARLLDVALPVLLGPVRDAAVLYGSGGFTTQDDGRLRQRLREWLECDGVRRVKVKIGESWGTCEQHDLARLRLVRDTVGDDVELYVDANGGYTVKQAIRVARAAAELDVRWFEEPVSSDDLTGLARVRRAVDAEVAAGEYGTGAAYFKDMCAAGAVDCLQADATRCGGYTGFLAAATIAAAFELDLSTHTAPQLHCPVACAVTNLRHLEWFDDHVRLERMLFDGFTEPQAGRLAPRRDRPGHGLSLREADAARFRVGG